MRHLLLLTIYCVVAISATQQTPYQAHLPIAYKHACALGTHRGIAWLHHSDISDLNKLCAYYYYNQDSYLHYNDPRAMIMIRPHNEAEIIAYVPPEFKGRMFVGNEGDYWSQDNRSPFEMYLFVERVRLAYPNATLVGPNLSGNYPESFVWMREFWSYNPSIDIPSLHIYPVFPDFPVRDVLIEFCEITDCSEIWVTEIGVNRCDPQSYEMLREWINILDDLDFVTTYFGYSNDDENGFNGATCSDAVDFDMIDEYGNLTNAGRAFVDASK